MSIYILYIYVNVCIECTQMKAYSYKKSAIDGNFTVGSNTKKKFFSEKNYF